MYFEVFNLMSRSVANAHNSCYLLNPHRGVPRPACQWPEAPFQSSLCAGAWSRDFLDDCVAMEAPHPRRLDLVWWSIHRPGSIRYFSPVSLLSSWKGEELSLQDYVDLSPLNFPQSSRSLWVPPTQTILRTVIFKHIQSWSKTWKL